MNEFIFYLTYAEDLSMVVTLFMGRGYAFQLTHREDGVLVFSVDSKLRSMVKMLLAELKVDYRLP